MDSLLVDLDKVLDDFEAEERSAPGRERTPSGYQEYLEKTSDINWGAANSYFATDQPYSSDPYSSGNLNVNDKPSGPSGSVRYDFPYEPENFDLSEADFAPSPNVGKTSYNGTLEYSSNKPDRNEPQASTNNDYSRALNGFTDASSKLATEKELETEKDITVGMKGVKSTVDSDKASVEADLSPRSEDSGDILHMNGYKRPDNGILSLEMPAMHIASVPSLSSIESNSEFNKYPVQCNTPQTPKENPMENPLHTQLGSLGGGHLQDSAMLFTTGALTASQNSMQDIPKLQNLKDHLESFPQSNGNVENNERVTEHQPIIGHSKSLPASSHGVISEKSTSSLPTDLVSESDDYEINLKLMELKNYIPDKGQMGTENNCDMKDIKPSQNPVKQNIIGFGDADVDEDMDEKDLDKYLAEDPPNHLRQTDIKEICADQAPSVSADASFHQSNIHSEMMALNDPYIKPDVLSDAQYGVNLLQKVKNTNTESKPMVAMVPDNMNMKMETSDTSLIGKGHTVDNDPRLEVLKILPVGSDGMANLPTTVTTSVITQPDTNLSPNANMSIDSGCASMNDNQMESMALSFQTSDKNVDNGGARPKDTNNRINRPNSLRGLSTVNLNSESPFVMKPAMSPSDQMVGLDGGVIPDDMPKFQESVVINTEQMVVEDSRRLMEVDDMDDNVDMLNQPVSDMLDGDVVMGQPQTGQESHEIDTDSSGDIDTSEVEMRRDANPHEGDITGRRRSWSPADSGQAQVPKQKRPTSLNLPPPLSFNTINGRSLEDAEKSMEDQTGATGGNTDEQEHMAEEARDVTADETVEGAEAMELPPDLPPDMDPPPPYSPCNLGEVAPMWIPDAEAPACMSCEVKFTFTKRRHHCRACGKVFCSSCCRMKNRLPYMKNQEARVCVMCHSELALAERSFLEGGMRGPHPNNPSDYCSVIPPSQAASSTAPGAPPPSVLVPVLKRDGNASGSVDGSARRSGEPKQVMFSDGIRPGGDLTELDGRSEITRMPPRRSRQQKRVERVNQGGQHSPRSRRLRTVADRTCKCLIPEEGLPPIAVPQPEGNEFDLQLNPDPEVFMPKIKDEESPPVIFALNTNLQVLVKIVNLECCVNRVVWCFSTRGMTSVGQEEIIVVLETLPDESTLPRDIFTHLHNVYEDASKGNTVTDMGHSIFNQSYLGSREHGGFLYIRATFQCVQKLILPEPPYLFAILLQKWETPWAKVFPLRLLLRLGAEYRYYPCPLIGVRNRKPVFFEIGHTIMNLLADFRNFQYMLPSIKGITIHMEDKITKINFPTNRYDDLMKVVNNSNEHVMAVAANFSVDADSHLVCIQNDDGNYQTQAINIQNKPRKVTGASFVVFNGALKSSSGLSAKSSIVEDGLMVQITPDSMIALKQAIKDMQSYTVQCGVSGAPKPDETVIVQWTAEDKNVNIGVKSPIDGFSLDGVESLHVHNSTDYVGDKQIIRWTEIFFIQNEDSGSVKWEPVDLSRLGETLATACCVALTPHLEKLKEATLTKIGLRVKLGPDDVGYEAGAKGARLPDVYMNDLDNELIPVIHRATQQDGAIVLELIFQVLD